MDETTKFILDELENFRQSPEGYGAQLRQFLSRMILDRLDELGWSQRYLAQKIGKRESFVSRVVHEGSNCTFDVAGVILHALELPPAIFDTTEQALLDNPLATFTFETGETHGRETKIEGTRIQYSSWQAQAAGDGDWRYATNSTPRPSAAVG